jgi:hypothetical protein
MKITGVTMMAAIAGTSVWAGAIPVVDQHVTVCMANMDIRLENRTKEVASDIFAGIGVKILWHSPRNCPAGAILITLSNDTPASLFPGALAYALPYERTHIVVFYDRVKSKSKPGSTSCLLGHVLAHEVTHILQGLARHSESGLMKAQWTGADYQQMTWEPLQFTDDDVTLIHSGRKARGPAS